MSKEPELEYPELYSRWRNVRSENDLRKVDSYLVGIWLDDYFRLVAPAPTNVVRTSDSGFWYLYDVHQGRLIAAWGISKGKSNVPRDRSRMSGHPLSNGALFHRGHAIPHQMGGSTDINLVPQLGLVNQGKFRERENTATRKPGALYFTYWVYKNSDTHIPDKSLDTQTPAWVQQAVLLPDGPADVRWFENSV